MKAQWRSAYSFPWRFASCLSPLLQDARHHTQLPRQRHRRSPNRGLTPLSDRRIRAETSTAESYTDAHRPALHSGLTSLTASWWISHLQRQRHPFQLFACLRLMQMSQHQPVSTQLCTNITCLRSPLLRSLLFWPDTILYLTVYRIKSTTFD